MALTNSTVATTRLCRSAPCHSKADFHVVDYLDFPILSDAKAEVAHTLGIRFALPDYLIDVYKGFRNDLPLINGDPSWVLPMPARYVIGTDGVIAYAQMKRFCLCHC